MPLVCRLVRALQSACFARVLLTESCNCRYQKPPGMDVVEKKAAAEVLIMTMVHAASGPNLSRAA